MATDEEEEEEEEEEESDDEEYELEEGDLESDGDEDVYALLNRAASMASRRQLEQFPLLREWTPPVMRHELAAELSMRSAAASLRGAPHPLARQAMPDSNCSISNAAAAGPAGPEAPPTPPAAAPLRPKRLNPAHALLLREARQGSSGGHMLPEQCAHFAAFHRLPREPTRVFDQRPSRAYIGQFTPAGDVFIAAFQHERRIRMYDVHQGFKLVKDVEARGLQWTVTDTALSGDNRFLLYSSITPEVHLVNTQSTDSVHSVANVTDIHETLDFGGGRSHRLGIWSIEWTPDSREIVAGTSDPGLRVFDMMQMRTVAQVGGHSDDVNAVAYAEPEAPNVIFSGSDDSFVKVWDRRTMDASGRRCRPAGVFVGHTEGVTHLDSKGDGRYVISNSKDQSIKLWDTRKMAAETDAARLAKGAPSFHWDYRWMEYPARGRVVQHPGCQAVQTYRGHAVLSTLIRSYWSPAATTGQRYIYTGSYDGRVHVYDAITALPVAKLGGYHKECVRDCSWHPHLPMLATVAFDGACTLWEPEVPGDADMAVEEAAAVAAREERRQPGSGQKAARRGIRRAAADLPAPGSDQLMW
ncbi:LEC14B -like isoform X2 isoform A [Chlorella sorokiniana]|uniref:LEC14B-like isoform X2 isoform A n=1 Tax=Chlorella sorokiniana TaxID=3076 RepID=A0A2P6U0S7_CHLSO|nr:LEC14B -like isoform X2 isoform A [Chlorella sorokiniana]|eukprot:PRW59922.1 LEC14B -like isoform X2 isoform A [Chlorella sorokiniana]